MAKGIVLTPQVSNPLSPTQRGIWVSNTGDMVYSDTSTDRNISQTLTNIESGTGITKISKVYLNSSGVTIPAKTPVYSPAAGEIAMASGSSSATAKVIGLTDEAIAHLASGPVVITGILEGLPGYNHNSYLYLNDAEGEMIDVAPAMPSYPDGFQIVTLGIVEGSNLIVRPTFVGEL